MLLSRITTLALAAVPLSVLLSACSYMPQISPSLSARLAPRSAVAPQEAMAAIKPREHMLFAVTEGNLLVSFNASTPGLLFSKTPLTGLAKGETLLGIDFRVAKGELFGLSSQGRLLRIHLASGAVTAVGKAVPLPKGDEFGVDFNPTVDRLRVVNNTGANLRLHPDTGAMVDGDPALPGPQPDQPLAYLPGDLLAGNGPDIVAAAYTYDQVDEKITTEYAIDARLGYLVIQGSLGTAKPYVSPNTGVLQAVGPLNIEPFERAALDISDLDNTAYLVTTRQGARESRLYEVDLGSGQARLIGAIASDQPIRGMSIEP
ncbi:MAG: DUF4394 domain-containing protein [Rubrivivax sp.]|nr:MAG: DUF4394 domain-containing protein [Rubrivivax sp.]